jgi:hypothetical protein
VVNGEGSRRNQRQKNDVSAAGLSQEANPLSSAVTPTSARTR